MVKAIDLNDIRLLMQVIEHGSYTAASRATGVPKSTISQRITTLEKAVGMGLLRRTSRSFSLTEAGSLLLPHARDIEALAKKVEQVLLQQSNGLAGTLRMSCCSALAQHALSPLLPRFVAQHPGVIMRLETTNRLIDLIGEGFDMAIRSHAGPLRDSSLLQRVIARTSWSIVAAPGWIARNGTPAAPDEIPLDEALCFSSARDFAGWHLRRGDAELLLEIHPKAISDDIGSLRNMTLADGGVACLPDYMIAGALREGHLVRLLPEWSPAVQTISLLTPPRAQSSRLARAFSDFIASELPGALLSHGSQSEQLAG